MTENKTSLEYTNCVRGVIAMKRRKSKNVQPYDTYALSEAYQRDKRTNAAIPSLENVEKAKAFVEENKK